LSKGGHCCQPSITEVSSANLRHLGDDFSAHERQCRQFLCSSAV